jgi:hypothetical protein
MTWVATIAKPFVRLLSVSTHGTLKLLRIDNSAARGDRGGNRRQPGRGRGRRA